MAILDYATSDGFRIHFIRIKRLFPSLALAWTVVSLGAATLAGLRSGPLSVRDVVAAGICGVVMGLCMAWFETRPVRRNYLNRLPYLDVLFRALLYSAAVIGLVLLGWIVFSIFFPEDLIYQRTAALSDLWADPQVRRFIFSLIIAAFVVNFILHVRLAMGPDNMRAFFLGTYRLPMSEERMFLFMDLVGSTSIAQRLGPLEFTHFKHEFFCDLSGPIAATEGTIVQYVGDEVMLTWRKRDLSPTNNPLRFLTLVKRKLADRSVYYSNRFGAHPLFRTGIHAGEVVVAEVGDTRRDIVYSGDVVNTAARLLQACRPAEVMMLVSKEAADWLGFDPHGSAANAHNLSLRGRDAPIVAYDDLSPVQRVNSPTRQLG